MSSRRGNNCCSDRSIDFWMTRAASEEQFATKVGGATLLNVKNTKRKDFPVSFLWNTYAYLVRVRSLENAAGGYCEWRSSPTEIIDEALLHFLQDHHFTGIFPVISWILPSLPLFTSCGHHRDDVKYVMMLRLWPGLEEKDVNTRILVRNWRPCQVGVFNSHVWLDS